jgi:hypothetical protein
MKAREIRREGRQRRDMRRDILSSHDKKRKQNLK